MQGLPLPVMIGVFAAMLLTLLLILRALPDNGKLRKRLERIKQTDPRKKDAKRTGKAKASLVDNHHKGQKSDFFFRTLGTDVSAMQAKLRRAGLSLSLIELFLIYALVALALATLVTVVARMINPAAPFLYTVPGGVLLGFLSIRFWLNRRTNRRTDAFNDNFPDALELMARCLRSGIPITEMFKSVGENSAPPVSGEFRRMYSDICFGIPLSEAIWRAAARMPTQEFIFFAISVSIQSETGGNLVENLEKLTGILRNRLQVKRMIKTKSAEARLTSRLLTAMPFLFVGGLYFMSPQYLEVFLEDPRGHTTVIVLICMVLTGTFITNRMTKFGY